MAEASGTVELVLEDQAMDAVSQIARLLGAGEEEAVQRALGTELYLLDQVLRQRAKVFIESKEGRRELDLLNK